MFMHLFLVCVLLSKDMILYLWNQWHEVFLLFFSPKSMHGMQAVLAQPCTTNHPQSHVLCEVRGTQNFWPKSCPLALCQ